jgi:hypothetical protein
VVKGQYLRSSPRLAAGAVIASSDTPGRFHQADGAMTDDAMQSAQGARRAPPNLPAPRPAPTPYATPYATPPAPRPLRHAPARRQRSSSTISPSAAKRGARPPRSSTRWSCGAPRPRPRPPPTRWARRRPT